MFCFVKKNQGESYNLGFLGKKKGLLPLPKAQLQSRRSIGFFAVKPKETLRGFCHAND
jgi:hypothetical protein